MTIENLQKYGSSRHRRKMRKMFWFLIVLAIIFATPLFTSAQINPLPPAASQVCTEADKEYVVVRGDTCEGISTKMYGIYSLWPVFMKANNLTDAVNCRSAKDKNSKHMQLLQVSAYSSSAGK